MRLAILAGVLAAGLCAPPAHACTRLPAPSATGVPIGVVDVHGTKRTALRVCAGGRVVELARATQHKHGERFSGARIGAASAAGHRVAWIFERHRGGMRTAVVTLAVVGRRVRVLRRFTVQRRRTRERAELDVLLTRHGDLAWLAGTYGGRTGVVAVSQPRRPARRLAAYPAERLAIEDGRTLRWDEIGVTYHFFDLRRRPCPSRARYKVFARNDRVILTSGVYGRDEQSGTTVIRGCDPATGRDRVILENYSEFTYESYLSLVGLDRSWAVFVQTEVGHEPGPVTVTVADVLTGRTRSAAVDNGEGEPEYPAPAAGGFAVTTQGVLGWLGDGALYALVETGKVVKLDEGGTLAGLHADGDALAWTHDGAPRRVVPESAP